MEVFLKCPLKFRTCSKCPTCLTLILALMPNQEKPNKPHITSVLCPKATCLVNTRGDFKHTFQKPDSEAPRFLSHYLYQVSLSITTWLGQVGASVHRMVFQAGMSLQDDVSNGIGVNRT